MKLVLATQENYQEVMKNMQCLTTDPQFDQKSDRENTKIYIQDKGVALNDMKQIYQQEYI